MTGPAGRLRTRAALCALLPAEHVPQALTLTDLFSDPLEAYAELIAGPNQRPAGFMTRGEDAHFTGQAQIALGDLGMPPAALAHHRTLSNWFEHKRAFFKVEWLAQAQAHDRSVAPLAACYFRRRPPVDEVVTRLSHLGVGPEARELALDVAGSLEKDTVHFVSAAFRPDHAVHHKLYFSQWVTPDTRDRVTARLLRVFQLLGIQAEEGHFSKNHARCMQLGESTLFVSISFSEEGIVPSCKIDYPGIGAARAAAWLPAEQQEQVIADADALCTAAGSSVVTYLGVRYRAGQSRPSLKYYCDVPEVAEAGTA